MGNCGIILLRRVRCTCDKLNYRSYKRLNEYHNIIKIGDSDNVSKTTMRFYLIVLSMAGLIMMRQVIHLSTFQPPVHNASLDALWPVKDFYRR
jgi:hypothetical protein